MFYEILIASYILVSVVLYITMVIFDPLYPFSYRTHFLVAILVALFLPIAVIIVPIIFVLWMYLFGLVTDTKDTIILTIVILLICLFSYSCVGFVFECMPSSTCY